MFRKVSLKHNDISLKAYKTAHTFLEQNTLECIFEGMGQEYDQLYCKYQVDSLISQETGMMDYA